MGFYGRFRWHYVDKSTPMTKLLRKQCGFIWDNLFHNAFLDLKKALAKASILVTPNWEKEFHVHVDALAFAIGFVSFQPDDKGFDHPIYYVS